MLMKKLLLSLSLLLSGYAGFSQVSFGVKSGINIATTKGLIEFVKNRVGWYGGGFATIPINEKFYLQPELLYSSKGNGEKYKPYKTVLTLNYLDVPIVLGYKIDHKTSLVFGPELGYFLSAHRVYNNNENFNVSKNYPSKFDVGLDIGLKYMAIKDILIEVRYSYGLKTFYAIDEVCNRTIPTNAANRVFQIGINYLF